mgnify:FL=1
MKKLLNILILLMFSACSEPFLDEPVQQTIVEQAINEDATPVLPSEKYKLECYRTEYYFCPGVSGPLFRIAVVKDVCKDPPEVISMSECEEFLECDPSQFKMGEEDCTTPQGLPGKKTVYCDKGPETPGQK